MFLHKFAAIKLKNKVNCTCLQTSGFNDFYMGKSTAIFFSIFLFHGGCVFILKVF